MKLRRIWVVPDVHVPYHSERAWRLALKILRKFPADHLVVIGDFLDLYCVADYLKDPKRTPLLMKELMGGRRLLNELRDTVRKGGSAVYCMGNHEERLKKRIRDRLPALEGALGVGNFLDLNRWEVVPYGKAKRLGKFWFSHEFGSAGVGAGRASLLAVGDNCVFGHSHRAGVVYGGTALGQKHVSLNVGWLGNPRHADYIHETARNRDWIHGLGHILMEPSGVGHASFVPFLGGRAVVEGELVRL